MIPHYGLREKEEEHWSHKTRRVDDDDDEHDDDNDDMPDIPTGMPTDLPRPPATTDAAQSGRYGPGWGSHHISGVSTGTAQPSETTLKTSTASKQTAWPDGTPSPDPNVVQSGDQPGPTSDDSHGIGPGSEGGFGPHKGTSKAPLYAVAGIVPVVLIIVGLFAFFCLRKRKQKRMQIAAAQAKVSEMKMSNQQRHTVHAYVAPPPPPPEPQYTAPPRHPPPPSPTTPQPVILGPITGGGSNGAYFTGIDTSDVVSMNDAANDRTGLGDPFADSNSLQEEPPPPYRPRSIAPLSRDTSLRVPAASSQTNLIGSQQQQQQQHQAGRSPFDDPEDDDDDAVSQLSGPTLRRNQDAISTVSDMSYQEDPVVARRNV
ncbi:hypothetical protein BS50DRAFT_581762 [Corynespora cassiicola Philippines]|uniref:Uncharacterized protein n=1 Tax=Corynespora cassiicola Philippines TaxID=1448308 RepID=A0A2T2PBU7_CORCC|nr:hypothetical protein BS50DRAFT_581762 [Corynespora cassiicola Philippines]